MRGSIQKLIERRKEMIEFKQEKVVKNINKKTGDSTSMREAKLNMNYIIIKIDLQEKELFVLVIGIF